ncbi:MAG TPA: (2Fe-2S)-binding protein, partial [Planctomycetaceae bacterium]|nr:(2Fe-2S)-binding protein [Planctomycetaceae bacterium]
QHCQQPDFAAHALDPVVCHCLHVTEMEIRGAVSTGAVNLLKDVMDCTGAGTGCTACHHRIRELCRERKSPQELIAQAPF